MNESAFDPRLLTLAICHEVGNHLAAIRLSAYLLTTEGSEPGMGDELSALSTEAGLILSQVRFLQSPPLALQAPTSIRRVMQDLRFSLGDKLDGPVEVQFEQEIDLECKLRCEKELLVRQLTYLMSESLRASEVGQAVTLNIRPVTKLKDGGGVCFAVSDTTVVEHHESLPGDEPRRGRLLGLQVVHTLITARGGQFSTYYSNPGLRAELCLPFAE